VLQCVRQCVLKGTDCHIFSGLYVWGRNILGTKCYRSKGEGSKRVRTNSVRSDHTGTLIQLLFLALRGYFMESLKDDGVRLDAPGHLPIAVSGSTWSLTWGARKMPVAGLKPRPAFSVTPSYLMISSPPLKGTSDLKRKYFSSKGTYTCMLYFILIFYQRAGIRNLSPHLRNSAILRTTKSVAELRTKKSCGTAIVDLENLTSAIPQLSAVSCQFRYFLVPFPQFRMVVKIKQKYL
jgi:hypothetical protein